MIKEKTPQNFDQLEKSSVKFSKKKLRKNHVFSPWGWTNQPHHRGGRLGFLPTGHHSCTARANLGKSPNLAQASS